MKTILPENFSLENRHPPQPPIISVLPTGKRVVERCERPSDRTAAVVPCIFFIGSYNAATSTVGTGDWYKDMEGGRVPIHGHLWHRQMPYRHFQTSTRLPSESSHGRFSPNTKIHANHPVISLLYLTKPQHVFLILERETYKVDGCPTTTTIIYTDSSHVVTLDFNNPTNPKYHLPLISGLADLPL